MVYTTYKNCYFGGLFIIVLTALVDFFSLYKLVSIVWYSTNYL